MCATVVAACAGENSPALGNVLTIALDQHYYHYSEIFDEKTLSMLGQRVIRGEPKSDEYGYTALLDIGATVVGRSYPLYASAFFRTGGGKHTYDGATQETVIEGSDTILIADPYETKKNNEFTAYGIGAGPYFSRGRYLLGFQAGIEYHSWSRKLFPMKEIYKWFYVPLTVHATYRPSSNRTIGCRLSCKFMVSGAMQIDLGMLGDMMGDVDAPVLALEKKVGLSIELPIQTGFAHLFGLEFRPWFGLRPSGISNVDTITISDGIDVQRSPFLEPASNSYSFGMCIGVAISDMFTRQKSVRTGLR